MIHVYHLGKLMAVTARTTSARDVELLATQSNLRDGFGWWKVRHWVTKSSTYLALGDEPFDMSCWRHQQDLSNCSSPKAVFKAALGDGKLGISCWRRRCRSLRRIVCQTLCRTLCCYIQDSEDVNKRCRTLCRIFRHPLSSVRLRWVTESSTSLVYIDVELFVTHPRL